MKNWMIQPISHLALVGSCVALMSCGNSSSSSKASVDCPPADSSWILEASFPHLTLPSIVGLVQAPEQPDYWYAVLQEGVIARFSNDPLTNQADTFLDLRDQVRFGGEMGFLSMAFHPDFPRNGQFFVSYNRKGDGMSIISRWQLDDTGLPDAESEIIVLSQSQPASNHNGGQIAFGPDGMLYIAFGDGGGANDSFRMGQNPQTWHSKLLRIDVNSTTENQPYKVPSDNPFISDPKFLPEIYAHGFRNPWRWSFDAQTGELWLADVGQNAWEEVNLVVAGGNYGWPIMEGKQCFGAAQCDQKGLMLPVIDYAHGQGDCSITGGFVYRGSQQTGLIGRYVYGDFCSGRIWALNAAPNNSVKSTLLADSDLRISSFAQGLDGEIYALNHPGKPGQGIYQLVETTHPQTPSGCN